MAYGTDLKNAARRHLKAAQHLDHVPPAPRRDVAGYLYGLAAELALKELMRCSGMRPCESGSPDGDDAPFRLHFPGIKTALRDRAEGRCQGTLLQIAMNDRLMNQWDICMRYAHARDVLSKPITEWAEQAKELVQKMETL